ncbi:hypothetical protein D3C73_987450 [compost metagenome]
MAGDGIDIAGVGDQGRRRDLFQIARGAAPSSLHGVCRQPPSGIEGRAEAAHRQAPQQRLEPQRRGHDIDRIHRRQQVGGPHVGVDQGDAVQLIRWDAALLAPCGHGGVALDDQLGVRLVAPGGRQHVGEALLAGQSIADGGVAEGLVHDQHPAAGLEQACVQRPAHIGLGHAGGDDAVDQRARPTAHRIVAPVGGGLDQMLQPTGSGGVVIDAQIIDDQAEAGRAALADPDRAQEAVFQRDIGFAVLRRPASARLRRRLHAPAEDDLDRRTRQGGQVVIGQEGGQERHLQHPRRTDPGAGFRRGRKRCGHGMVSTVCRVRAPPPRPLIPAEAGTQ